MRVFGACILLALCVISESLDCPADSCWEDNTWWDGPGCCIGEKADNMQSPIANSYECAKKCQNESNCKLATYWYAEEDNDCEGQPKRYCRMHSDPNLDKRTTNSGALANGVNFRDNDNPYRTIVKPGHILTYRKGCGEFASCWTANKIWNGPGLGNGYRKIEVCSSADCKRECADHDDCQLITYWRQPDNKQFCRLHSSNKLKKVSDTSLPNRWTSEPGKISTPPAGTIFYTSSRNTNCDQAQNAA